MPAYDFEIGRPASFGSSIVRWGPDVLASPIPGILLADPDAVLHLARLRISTTATDAQFRVSESETDSVGSATGQEMSAFWENHDASITFFVPGENINLILPGPNHPDNPSRDTEEPYSWSVPNATSDAISDFISAYAALSQAIQATLVVTLDDGREIGRPATPDLTITAVDTITVGWVIPDDNGLAITGQTLGYREQGTEPWTDVPLGPAVTSYQVAGLAVGVVYEFRVRATNLFADGDYSPIAATAILPPNQVTTPAVTADSTMAITVGWVIPDDNGLAITGQTLGYREQGTEPWTDVPLGPAVTSYQVAGLAVGTAYEFRVAATNAAGLGDYSNIASALTDPEVPAAPADPTYTVLGETVIRIMYVAPAYDGNSAITGYLLQYREQGTEPWTDVPLGPAVLSHTVANLAADTTYEFRVAAQNIAGTGAFSGVVSAMTEPPNQMPVLEDLFDQTVEGGVAVILTAVASDPEGHPLTYLWERVSGPAVVLTDADMAVATFPAPLSATPSVFVFRVTVTDPDGSAVSADTRISVRAVPFAPAAPGEPDVVAIAPTILRADWNTPAENNSPLLSFEIRYRPQGTPDWFTITGLPPGAVIYSLSGLMPDTAYEVEVRAVNAIGPGNWSPTGTGRTAVPEPSTVPLVGWLANFMDSGHRFWSGEGDLTIGGEVYQGNNFISLSTAEASLDAPRRRMTASFPAIDAALRAALMQDPGPLVVEIRWIYSLDHGQTWLFVPRKFVGRLSSPVIRAGTYTIEIETFGGDVDRGRPLRWSDEDQQRRFPGDRGMEYMRELSEGIDTKWPP